ncbi:MAG: phosphopantetheine-binding protein [Mesorhizobium sp.]
MLTKDDILEFVRQSGADIAAQDGVYTKPLVELGLDSLDIFNALNEVEKGTGVNIPDEQVEKLQTIEDILKFVLENSAR